MKVGIASFRMKSYRSSLTFITVELLFNELLKFVKNGFPDFSVAALYENVRRNNGCRSEFVGAGGGPVLLLAILSVCLLILYLI